MPDGHLEEPGCLEVGVDKTPGHQEQKEALVYPLSQDL